MLNLNNHPMQVSSFENGITQNVEVKFGRKIYLVDVIKNSSCATIQLYNRLSSDRNTFSKYDKEANLHTVRVKSDAYLVRDFFENIEAIESAQALVNDLKGILYM